MTKAVSHASLSGKIVACVLVLACVAVGMVGLVLPIIPGLLFLGIAVFIAARYFPAVGARLRRHRAIRRHLDRADGVRHLSPLAKAQVAGLICLQMLLDGLAAVVAFVSRLGGRHAGGL